MKKGDKIFKITNDFPGTIVFQWGTISGIRDFTGGENYPAGTEITLALGNRCDAVLHCRKETMIKNETEAKNKAIKLINESGK